MEYAIQYTLIVMRDGTVVVGYEPHTFRLRATTPPFFQVNQKQSCIKVSLLCMQSYIFLCISVDCILYGCDRMPIHVEIP